MNITEFFEQNNNSFKRRVKMVIANLIAYILVLLGATNWGSVGIFDFNLVGAIFGGYRSAGAIVVYCIILLAAIWLVVSPILTHGKLYLRMHRANSENTRTESSSVR